MSRTLKAFWRLVNEAPLNPRRLHGSAAALGRLFRTFFWRPHRPSMLLILIAGSLAGSLAPFFYAWCGRFVADEIVQVHLLSKDVPAAAEVDPAWPDEHRNFALDEPRDRTSFRQQHAAAAGRSLHEKLALTGYLALLLLAVIAGDQLLAFLARERTVHVGQKVQFHLRHRLYEKLHALPMQYHDRHSPGYLMTHLFSDVNHVQQMVLMLFQGLPKHVVMIGVGVAVLFSVDVFLATLVIVALPTYVLSYRWFKRRLRVTHANLREREGRLNAQIANRISNFYLVKSYGRETHEALDFVRKGRKIVRDNLAVAVLSALFMVICGILSGVCMTAVLWIGALKMQSGALSLGTLLLFYTSAGFLFRPVSFLTGQVNVYHRVCAISQRLMRVVDEPVTLVDAEAPLPVPRHAPEIRFDAVTMRYDPKRPPALRDLSFSLPAGKSLCVMGPSGSGKTTLAKLACRIYDPSEGAVRLDGIDVRRFRLAALHRFAGFVTQEPVIFDGTIAANIRYGSEASEANAIVEAAQYAQIHDYIVRLPEQYETLTRERGLTLSGGQKQRVNLARTLLYDPRMIVLDDCTSSLDAETEAKLVRGFEDVLQGRTAILVSHRISVAMRCDYVLMLDDARAVQFGRPAELLETEGPFADLERQQARSAENEPLHLTDA